MGGEGGDHYFDFTLQQPSTETMLYERDLERRRTTRDSLPG